MDNHNFRVTEADRKVWEAYFPFLQPPFHFHDCALDSFLPVPESQILMCASIKKPFRESRLFGGCRVIPGGS